MLSDSEKQTWARIEHDLRSDPEFDQAGARPRADLHGAGRWTGASVPEVSGHAPSARVRAGTATVALLGIGLLLAAAFTRSTAIAVVAGLLAPLAVLALILTIGWALTGAGRRRPREPESEPGRSQQRG